MTGAALFTSFTDAIACCAKSSPWDARRTPVIEEIHHEDEILGKAYDAALMADPALSAALWKLLTFRYFLLLQTGGQLLGPYITKVAMTVIAERDVHGSMSCALAYLGVVLFGFVVLFIQTYVTNTPASGHA